MSSRCYIVYDPCVKPAVAVMISMMTVDSRLEEPPGADAPGQAPPRTGPVTKAAQVRSHIRSMIESGRLAPGARVNVDAMARELGISKIPVREAVSQLEALGLVVTTPNAGARVAQQSARDLRGFYLLRLALEPLSARLAAQAREPAALARAEELVRSMRRAVALDDYASLAEANRAFHVVLARAGGYRPVADSVEDTLRRLAPYPQTLVTPGTWRNAVRTHAALIARVEAGDAAGAESLARAHVIGGLAESVAADVTAVIATPPASANRPLPRRRPRTAEAAPRRSGGRTAPQCSGAPPASRTPIRRRAPGSTAARIGTSRGGAAAPR